ncbi:glycosyltransferase family 2 protein [Candidatus Woesearchaeota archaeon]|nr:glycosyltransferase family 2 protein [Candidatus Woesearchaeota archaeon]
MKTLSIIIPVYNEKENLLKILCKVEESDVLGLQKEIVLVDDCSTDGTRELLKKLKHKVILHRKNGGKGRALRTGFKHARGDIILIQDADLEYDPVDYPKLLKPILDKKTNIVYGTRFYSQKGHLKENRHMTYRLHFFGNYILTLLTNILYNSNITDMETCYKVFTKNALLSIPKLKARRFDFEPEITSKFLKNGSKIIEVPIKYYSRDFSEGKKITWKDGVKAAYYLIYYRLFD